jgi:acetolactate synthase small subunit
MTLQFRRGTDSDRLTITPSAGEPIWTTDTEKLYVGDGSTAGGILATGGTGGTDSATVSTIITATVDSAYINARTDANLDSAATLNLINAAYIQSNQITYNTSDFADSAFVTSQINAISIPTLGNDFVDSGQVTNIVDASYIQSNQTTYNTSDFADSAFVTSQIAAISIPTLGNDFVDSSAARGLLSGGTGVTYNSGTGEISIGQAVGITDSAVFASLQTAGNVIVGGNLQVTGTTTTVNSEDLNVTDNMIYMNAGESSGSPTASIDVGWAANVNDDGSYTHVGMFRDATDNTFKVFGNYTPEPNAAVEINTGHASFTLAPFAASTLSGEYLGFDSDVTAAGLATQTYVTTRPISTFTNDANYLDSTTVQGVINSSYIQSNQTTYNTSDFADSAFVTSQIAAISIPTLGNDFVDSAQVQLIVDSAYVQLRQSAGGGTVDSADIIAIVDSAYIQARQTTVAAGATTITQYDYEADSGQTTFTGADIDGQSLSYTAGKLAVYLNGILLVDSNDYTATNGSSIVLTSGVDSGDTLSIIAYVTEAVGTLDSAGVTNLIDSAYIQARQLDSAATATNALNLEGNPYTYYLDHNNFSNTPTIPTLGNDFVDSGQVSSIISGTSIDAATLNSQAASYYLDYNNFTNTPTIPTFGNDYVDSAFVTTQVNSLVAGAPGALDTLNELAAALGDDADFATTVTNSIATKLDSAQVIALVDSAYVQLRQTAGGGTVDSADIIAIVDSAYIQLRQSTASSGATTISTFNYEADFGQTTFTGADIDGSTLTYTAGKLNVYLNGVLLVDSNDYTATNGSSIVLNTGADSSDIVSVISYITQAIGTLDSAGVTNLIDSAYVQARQITYTIPTLGNDFVDSGQVTSIIDASYIQSNQTTYNTSDFADSAFVTSQIAAISIPTLGNDFVDSGQVTSIVDASYIQSNQTTYNTADFPDSAGVNTLISSAAGSTVLAYDANLQGFVDAFTLPTSDGSANQVLVTNGSGTISFAEQSGGLDSALITQLIDSAYVQLRQTASGGGGGGTDSASVNTLIDAKLQVLDVSDIVGADGNYGEYLKSLGNGEAEWTDLATQAKQKAFAMALIFG